MPFTCCTMRQRIQFDYVFEPQPGVNFTKLCGPSKKDAGAQRSAKNSPFNFINNLSIKICAAFAKFKHQKLCAVHQICAPFTKFVGQNKASHSVRAKNLGANVDEINPLAS